MSVASDSGKSLNNQDSVGSDGKITIKSDKRKSIFASLFTHRVSVLKKVEKEA